MLTLLVTVTALCFVIATTLKRGRPPSVISVARKGFRRVSLLVLKKDSGCPVAKECQEQDPSNENCACPEGQWKICPVREKVYEEQPSSSGG